MAVYKVPQDVEADDKLIGWFSFRQFIYLIVVALSIAAAWALGQLFILLAVIPLPIIVFFGALALPLRKDQPMEVYLAAMVSFYLKPRRRLWEADGIEELIEITAPKTFEVQRVKNISRGEAQQRLGYLAQIVDSQGWSVRGQGVQAPNSPMNTDVYFAAQQVEDVLDSSNSVAQSLDYMIDQADAKHHQQMIDRMRQPALADPIPQPIAMNSAVNPYDFFNSGTPTAQTQSVIPIQPAVPTPVLEPAVVNSVFNQPLAPVAPVNGILPTFNPYPTDMQQSIIQPMSLQPTPAPVPAQTVTPTTSEKPVSAGIINLANNADLSIETIAREANRIHQQEERDLGEEVVISLR
jgi:PrgI family protein